jgi:hypothetical protein
MFSHLESPKNFNKELFVKHKNCVKELFVEYRTFMF